MEIYQNGSKICQSNLNHIYIIIKIFIVYNYKKFINILLWKYSFDSYNTCSWLNQYKNTKKFIMLDYMWCNVIKNVFIFLVM